jgi:hypothetical protein
MIQYETDLNNNTITYTILHTPNKSYHQTHQSNTY